MDNKEQLSKEQIEAQNNYFKTIMRGGAFMLFFMGSIVGLCVYGNKQKKDHLNVVIENKNGKLLVEDINTKEQRIVKLWYGLVHEKDELYIFPGDTINIKQDEDIYKKHKVVGANNVTININEDSIYARKQRALFNAEKQQMMKQR